MIKARGTTGDGRPLMVIGLSRENCERLLDNKPISFDAAELGLKLSVIILGGEDEEEIAEDLRSIGAV